MSDTDSDKTLEPGSSTGQQVVVTKNQPNSDQSPLESYPSSAMQVRYIHFGISIQKVTEIRICCFGDIRGHNPCQLTRDSLINSLINQSEYTNISLC